MSGKKSQKPKLGGISQSVLSALVGKNEEKREKRDRS